VLARTALVICAASSVARADHAHAPAHEEHAHELAASVSLVAARFDTLLFDGDYQGLVPALQLTHGRYAVAASAPVYRIYENGLAVYGLGDVVVHGDVTAWHDDAFAVGGELGVSAPTGAERSGLGMGHPMVMPAAWGRYGTGRLAVAGSLGASLGFAGSAHHHEDMMWPLVDPANRTELTWAARGDVAVARAWRVGAGCSGGVPLDASGVTRVIGGARAVWVSPRLETGVELQAGVAGDPFTLRGVAQTTLLF
jgi:hypothetical protein